MARLRPIGADDPLIAEKVRAAYRDRDRLIDLDKPRKPRMTAAEAMRRLMNVPPPKEDE